LIDECGIEAQGEGLVCIHHQGPARRHDDIRTARIQRRAMGLNERFCLFGGNGEHERVKARLEQAVLCVAWYNIRWLLRMIRKKGLGLFWALIKVLGLGGLLSKVTEFIQVEALSRDRNIVIAA